MAFRSPVVRRRRRRSPHLSGLAGAWLVLCTVCWAASAIVESLVWCVVLIVAAVCSTIVTCMALWVPDRLGVPDGAPTTRSARTGPVKRPAGARAGGSGTPRRCSTRCRQSTKPRASCDCSCGGRLHGTEADARQWLAGPEARRIERRVVREHKRGDGR